VGRCKTVHASIIGGGGDAVPGGISGSQDPSAQILHCLIQSTIARRAAKNAFLDLSDLENKKLIKCFHVITFTIITFTKINY